MIRLGPLPEEPLGVAVSGGGDSLALMLLLHEAGHKVQVATVNHGLRPEAAAEAASVAALCKRIGLPHEVLHWQSAGVKGNLQQAARQARQRLLGGWARKAGLRHIALGHTLDDQAETVLLRLLRGSGVDGLAAMAARRCDAGGLCWHRPLLGVRREALRAYLRRRGITWADDPSNDNPKYDRVKARHALAALAPLGLTPEGLAATATHMRRARQALEEGTLTLARRLARVSAAGEVTLQPGFGDAPRELQLRLLAGALGWVSGAVYRPRFAALEALLARCLRAADFRPTTLHGCTIARRHGAIVINREPAATPPPGPVTSLWDSRWRVNLKDTQNLQIRALGEDGLQYCTHWRESGHSRAALLASPSLWRAGALWAAPLAGFGPSLAIALENGEKGFYDALMTH